MKKNLNKRVLALIVACMMCLSMLPGTAWAAGECTQHQFELKHDQYGGAKLVCTVCGATCEQVDADGKHKLDTVVKAPTCTEPGIATGNCVTCGTITETIPALGHTLTWRQDDVATCFEKGNHTQYCTVCEQEFDHKTDDVLAADYNGQKWGPAGDGQHMMVCKKCEGKAEGHFIVASCEDKDGDQKCDDCGGSVVCDHHWGNHEDTSKYVAPTCTEKGQQVYVCVKCGEVVENKEVAPLGHEWGPDQVIKPATCTEAGEGKRECNRCNASEDFEIPATGHKCGTFTWDDNEHWSTCSVCGAVIGEKKPHEWTEVSRTDATCTEPGEIKYDCAVPDCNASKDEVIPALGHDIEESLQGATCETPGYVDVKCARPGCDYHEHVEAAAVGHDYKIVRQIEGDAVNHLLVCGNNEEHTMEAPHTYSEWVWTDWVTNEDGTTRTRTGSHTCTACAYVETDSQTEDVSSGENPGENPGGETPENPGGETPTVPDEPAGPTIPTGPVTPVTPPTGEDETDIPENDTPLANGTEDINDAENSDDAGEPEEQTDAQTDEQTDEVEIPEEETPLSEQPEEEILDEELPLAGLPEETEIPDEASPLAEAEEVEIPDGEIPQVDVPVTGDGSHVWMLSALLSAAGLMWLALNGRKREYCGK